MPYIDKERRYWLMPNQVETPKTAGELNFVLTEAILAFYYAKGPSYQSANDVIGALEGAKLEFYRRVVAPYEDKKIEENGDVY